MTAATLRFSALCSAFALIAGCGGSSGGGGSMGGGGGTTPTVINFKFIVGTPSVVATRVGSGSFTLQTPKAGSLSLSIPSGTSNFSIAYVCTIVTTAVSVPQEYVYELNTADGTAFTLECPVLNTGGGTGILTGNVDVSGIAGANQADIVAEADDFTVTNDISLTGDFSLSAVTGSDRVEVLAYNAIRGGSVNLVAARNFASQTVPGALNGGNAVVLGAADQTTMQPITYNPVPSGYSSPTTTARLEMSGGPGFAIGSLLANQYPELPAGALQAGDIYELTALSSNSSKQTEVVFVVQNSTSGGPVSFTFPSPWTYAGPTPAALPTFNVAYSGFSGKPAVMNDVSVGWFIGNGAESFYEVSATGNYQNGSTTVQIPDLSNLAGFLANPGSGTVESWTAVIGQNTPTIVPLTSANSTGVAVLNSGTFTVP